MAPAAPMPAERLAFLALRFDDAECRLDLPTISR